MYCKQCVGVIFVQKSNVVPNWVQRMHHDEGKTHCEECLKLDGCWFSGDAHPPCPHHPYCHCTLEPINDAIVLANAEVHSDYSKFDPGNVYKHGKNKAFESWGYTIADSQWLKDEIERQVRERYISGQYTLGKLDHNGQRINIRVTIPRKDDNKEVSFITGWMAYPSGKIQLTTPYGGK